MANYPIWTPDQPFSKPASPNVRDIDLRMMRVIAGMDRIGQELDIVLACTRCRQPFKGFNHTLDKTFSIECGCRELRSVNPDAPAHTPTHTPALP